MIITFNENEVETYLRDICRRSRCLIPQSVPDYKTKFGLVPESREDDSRNYKIKGVEINPSPNSDQLGLVGFDLRIGNLIAKSDIVIDRVDELDLMQMDYHNLEFGQEFVLEPSPDGDNVYYIVSYENIFLNPNLEMIIDSKSTTGRIGCLSHLAGRITNQKLITIIQPYSFPILVHSGQSRLSQAVIRYKNSPYMTNQEITESKDIAFHDSIPLQQLLSSQGLMMRFNTSIAYKAKPYNSSMPPLDVDARNLDWREYYHLIEGNNHIDADKKTLYLLGSEGVIELGAVCGLLSREQGVLTGTGAWSHLAGIIQPYWKGGITMEFYSHEKRRVHNLSPAGYLTFDNIEGNVTPIEEGSYQNQKPPQLPKMFQS